MYNFKAFATQVEDLRVALDGKDVWGVDVDFQIWTGGISALRLTLSYRTEPNFGGDREEFSQTLSWQELQIMEIEQVDQWLHDARMAAWDWIDAIPSKEELEHRAFMAQLGRLIDKGREVGVDVDFLNPLTAMMEKLATNALEDKRSK